MSSKMSKVLILGLLFSSTALIARAEDAASAANNTAAASSEKQAAVKEDQTKIKIPATVASQMPVLSDDEKAKQAIMMEYMAVNEHHEFLKTLAGTWKAQVKFWKDPHSQPEESQGTSEGKMIMGGRFLEQTFSGTMMDQPFEGREILGYDNLKREYVGIWIDNMSTGIRIGSGQYNPDSKILLAEGTMSCPLTQETKRWYRDVMTFSDADNYTFETYMKDRTGLEYKAMVITYSRVR